MNWLRDLRAAEKNVDYHPDDIDSDMVKHAPGFGFLIAEKENYIAKAKEIIAGSKRVLVQMWRDGNIQFVFFGEDGYTVVDTQFFIRGCFPHVKVGGINKAFDAFKRKCLWLQQNKNN